MMNFNFKTLKNKIFIFIAVLIFGHSFQLKAQVNIQTISAKPVFSPEASFLNPSYLKDTRKFYLNFGINAYAGSNFVSAGYILNFTGFNKSNQNKFGQIHAFMDNLKPKNIISMQADATLFHAGYRIGKPANALNIGLSVRQHINATFSVDDDFFRLLYGGNKQFAGKTVSFNPKISALAYTDFGIAVSKSIKLDKLTITPAVRARYLLGNAVVYTKNSNLSLYTEESGEYLDLNTNLEAYASFADLDKISNFSTLTLKDIRNGMGNGIAFDIGATVDYENLSVSIASIDNGAINFKNNSYQISSQNNSIRWEGYTEDFDQNTYTKNINIDSIPTSFSTGIGSKITLNGNYGFNKKEDKKGYKYLVHNVGISYIQGLRNRYNATTNPMYAFYYQLNLKNRFTLGGNINGLRNDLDFGFNIGARLGIINIGFGSNSLITLINLNASKRFSFFTTMGITL